MIFSWKRLLVCGLGVAAALVGCAAPETPATQTTGAPTFPTVTEAQQIFVEPTEPPPEEFVLSFAGDCTLGTEHGSYGGAKTLVRVVGDDYDYIFENVKDIFAADDFTLVNLEGTFTDYKVPQQKRFRFRAPPAYAKILTAGSVEAANLANNHSLDYGETGYADTKTALEGEGIAYVEDLGTLLYTTERGLKIGIYAGQLEMEEADIRNGIQKLQNEGAELIITSFHWGVEGSYRPTDDQKRLAHFAIDQGADIVFGHHPHVLQPIEEYNGGIIYYSVGNFSFGGNSNPRDKDSVILQQTVIKTHDGAVTLGKLEKIPVKISTVANGNDYKPTPYTTEEKGYERALSKLDGTFTGKDLYVAYAQGNSASPQTGQETQPAPESTTAVTPEPTVAVTPEPTSAPEPAPTQTPTQTPDPAPENP